MNFCSERDLIVVTKMKRKALMLYKDASKFTFTKMNLPLHLFCALYIHKTKKCLHQRPNKSSQRTNL